MKLAYKIWLDYRGRAFGDGPARLLDGVEQTGSLRKAASELGMSYNKAWRILHAAEQRLGFALLDRSVGGSLGGGSHLTPRAQDLMTRYRALAADGRGGPGGGVPAPLLRLGRPRAGRASGGTSSRSLGVGSVDSARRGLGARARAATPRR